MSADARKTRRIPAPVAVLFAANAATQFAIQAWLAYGFAAYVWGLAQPLPYAAPIALDVFAVTLMTAAYSLRQAPLRQRVYIWFWLGVAIGAQVGASEGYADHAGWGWWGRIASLFPALFLAASLHALIIVARKQDQAPSDAPARVVVREVQKEVVAPTPRVRQVSGHIAASGDLGMRGQAPAPVTERPPRPDKPPAAPPLPSGRRPVAPPAAPSAGRGRPGNPLRADVIKRCLDANVPEDAKAVALELGLNVRTAQLWVSQERDRRAATPRSVTPIRETGSGVSGGESGPGEGRPPIGD